MRNAKKESHAWRVASTVSFISAALGFGCAVFFAIKLWYVPLIIAAVVALHGFFGGACYYAKSVKLADLDHLVSKMHESSIYDTAPLANHVGYKMDYATELLKRAETKGYMSEYLSEGYIMKNSMADKEK